MISSSKPKGGKVEWAWKGKPYALSYTPQDVLMLARAVQEEGYPQAGVAWALIQRWAWLNMMGSPMTLGALVQAYAQPLNPTWFPTGAKHQAYVKALQDAGKTAEAQVEIKRAALRPIKAARAWTSLSPTTTQTVNTILSGLSRSPVIGAVHYWASRGPDFKTNQAARPGMVLLDRGYGFGDGRNVFFGTDGSEGFGNFRIKEDGAIPWGSIATVALGGVLAFKVLKG